MALILNFSDLKTCLLALGAIAPLAPPLATAVDIILSLPFLLLRTEINKFISFVLHRKMCITELYKQFNRSLIIFVVHRNCLSLFFFCFFFCFFPVLTVIFLVYIRQNIEIYNEACRSCSSCACNSCDDTCVNGKFFWVTSHQETGH